MKIDKMITYELVLRLKNEAIRLASDERSITEGRFSFLNKMKFDYYWKRNDPYYFFIALLCEAVNPELAVDLGTCEGVSAYCMGIFSPSTRVITVDALENIQQDVCKLDNIITVMHDTKNLMPDELSWMLKYIDILFVDTYHEGDLANDEFFRWRSRMKENSIILFDGVTWPARPSMREWWEEFNPCGDLKIDLFDLHTREDAGFGAVLIG